MTLAALLAAADASLERALATPAELAVVETGTVLDVGGGIARVRGLPSVRAEELVSFEDGLLGIAIDLEPEDVGVVLLGPSETLRSGDEARATGRLVDVPVGEALLGRVLDATGRPLDDRGPLRAGQRRAVERTAPAIMDRAPVHVPLQTGIKVVDALIPIGRGQRELIIGDRQSGKTTIALDAILNQRDTGVVCVYCAIGQRGTAVARAVERLRQHGAMDYSVVVVASGEDAPGLQYITPFAATTIAEYFMEAGRDTLIVFDDLTRHARAYRELSLLLRRPPGREAYPGDIFYLHSRLLERATRLRPELGGGSLTALPIIETQAEDISSYIPTNLISITDGQIYVSPELFRRGILPAIDIGKSISRVGGKAQVAAYRGVAGELRLSHSQFQELETFARFATRLDRDTRAAIERGRRVREILKQPEHTALSVAEQIAVLLAVTRGLLDDIGVEDVVTVEEDLRRSIREIAPAACSRLDRGGEMDGSDSQALLDAIRSVVARHKSSHGG